MIVVAVGVFLVVRWNRQPEPAAAVPASEEHSITPAAEMRPQLRTVPVKEAVETQRAANSVLLAPKSQPWPQVKVSTVKTADKPLLDSEARDAFVMD